MFCISLLFHKKHETVVKNIYFWHFSTSMERLSIQSNVFEDSEDSSLPLLTTSNRLVSARPTCVYITTGSDKCFKVFENRFSKGLGTLRLSETMDEIRGTEVFKNLVQIISDVSGDLSSESKKETFSLAHATIWKSCGNSVLSKIDMDENPGILDDSDRMRIEDFNSLMKTSIWRQAHLKLWMKKLLWNSLHTLWTETWF